MLFAVGQALSATLYGPLAILCIPLPAVLRSQIIGGWAYFVVWWLRITCRITHEVSGIENLPQQPCVILSKHQSAWETIGYQVIFPAQTWVLKKELLWIPLFGWGLAATRPIAINRNAGIKALEEVVNKGVERLRGGRYVVVFPEGTRVRPGETGRYNPGGALLAIKAGVPILPVAHNAGECWPRRGFIKRPGTIQVVVGPPIESTGRRARDLIGTAEAWIESTMKTLTS